MALVDNPHDVEMGHTIYEFIDRISEFSSNCYFHNLKFDGTFIIDYLLRNGYVHTLGRGKEKGTFQTLISDMNTFYSITVYWESGHITEFRDSWKKFPMSVSNVAESFGFDEGKGEIDYHAPRPIGYVMNLMERDYLRRDVSIMAQALQISIANGMTHLTVASDSMAEYKRLTGAKAFTRIFPVLADSMDAEIRRAYRGGFTYCDPRFKGKVTGSGLVLDVNSLYPAVMYEKVLPFGEPEYFDAEPRPTESHPLTIFSVTITARIKPNHIPCIQIKGSSAFTPTEYISVIDEPTTIMVTNVDFDLYMDHYDIEILEWGGGWRFHGTIGLFDTYIDKWSTIKAESTGGVRQVAKLHLNSLYGKFGSNPNVTCKNPELVDDVVKLVRGADETRQPVYTAVAVFITSYAREITIRAAQANYGTFAYADTDSLHLLQDDVPESIDVHPTKMGAWKLEYHFSSAFYVRAKAYLELKVNGDYENHIAGLPQSAALKLTFDDIYDGVKIPGKKTPKAVPGGIVLRDIDFELKL